MKKYIIISVFLIAGMTSCVDEINTERFFEDNELTITGYLERNEDKFSMMIDLLDRAGFKSAFNAFGTYTLFVFDNETFRTYLQKNGLNSVSDLTVEQAKLLVRFHAFRSVIHSSNMGTGKLPVKNMEDDELVSTYAETGLQGIIINREAMVVHRDVELSNGMVHILDHTLTPIVKSVIEKLEELGNYTIFVEAAKATGFYDIMNQIYDNNTGQEPSRIFFTILAESDDIYHANAINSINDLRSLLDNGINDPTDPRDSLNKFVANHIIPERSVFTKDFQTGNYQSYYGELINMVIDRDFRINPHGPEDDLHFISFLGDQVDFPAKNGVVHTVNDILNIFYPEPVEILWEFNDQPGVRDLVRVDGQNSAVYTNFESFQNMWGSAPAGFFAHFPWTCYGFTSCDALILNGPGWDVNIRMPIRIVQGRYQLYFNYKDGSGRATIQILVNGVPIGEPINMVGPRWYSVEVLVGEINLPETTENEIRVVTVVNGAGQLDHLRFVPI